MFEPIKENTRTLSNLKSISWSDFSLDEKELKFHP